MTDTDKILSIDSDAAFEKAALDVFAFQARECEPYRDYLELMGIDPDEITAYEQIPHLPIEVFRFRKIYCGTGEPEKIFTSSTTGGDTPSKHYMSSLENYKKCFRKAFAEFYGTSEDWSFYALLPGYLEREGSSLIYMADDFIKSGGGGFFLNDHEELIRLMRMDKKQKILLGVSYALWDLAEKHAPKLTDTIVMETGGMKGKREELPKDVFHKILCDAFGVGGIHSEYGMAELSSQAYSQGEGIFRTPRWMRIRIRDLNDPAENTGTGKNGGINITDLGNLHSCAFIQTQDLGQLYEDGSFSIAGRIDRSQIRGCNLMAD